MADDYYKTLGVSREASEGEIRKAYRELAVKYHPDKNPDDATAKKKFQEVQVAFEVLNDSKKREQYDRFGPDFDKMGGAGGPFRGGGGPGGAGGFPGGGAEFDLNDLFGGGAGAGAGAGGFADLFKQFGGGGGPAGPGGRRGGPLAKGADLEHEITVPFATAITGGEAAIHLPGDKQVTIKIPAGIEDGKKIRLRGQGNPSPRGGEAGDLMLTVRVAGHPVFRRRGRNLEVKTPVTLAEAAAGAKIDVPTPKGVITLTVPPGTSSGKRMRVKGHGVDPRGDKPGDLYAEIEIELPNEMSEEDRATLAEVSGRYPQNPRGDLRW